MVRLSEDISAGFPSAAEGYEDAPLDLHDWLVPRPAATFFFRVSGDALAHEYIRDGSILVVDRSLAATRGRLVLAERDGEHIVCRDLPTTGVVVVCGVVTAVVTRL